MREIILMLALVVLLGSACGNGDTAGTTSALTTRPADTITTTTTTATTTTTPAATTIPPTTTTTTMPPPPVAAWDGEGVWEVALEFVDDPDSVVFNFERNMRMGTEWQLGLIGITVSDDAETVLLFDLVWEGLSATYERVGRCYSGATVSGTMTLSDPQHPPVDVPVSFTIPPPPVIVEGSCWEDSSLLPTYLEAFSPATITAITDLWQEAAVPMLMDYVTEDYAGRMLWRQVAAIDAFEGIDDEAIDPTDTVVFLGAVIDLVEYVVETGDTRQGSDYRVRAGAAASRLLEAYAGVDYGVGTIDDVEEWRGWLAAWDSHSP